MAKHLFPQKIKCYVLDGDKPLKGIIGHLGFSESDKAENIRTVAEIAHWMNDAWLSVIVALISPKNTAIKMQEEVLLVIRFFKEIYLNTPLFQFARNGRLRTFIKKQELA